MYSASASVTLASTRYSGFANLSARRFSRALTAFAIRDIARVRAGISSGRASLNACKSMSEEWLLEHVLGLKRDQRGLCNFPIRTTRDPRTYEVTARERDLGSLREGWWHLTHDRGERGARASMRFSYSTRRGDGDGYQRAISKRKLDDRIPDATSISLRGAAGREFSVFSERAAESPTRFRDSKHARLAKNVRIISNIPTRNSIGSLTPTTRNYGIAARSTRVRDSDTRVRAKLYKPEIDEHSPSPPLGTPSIDTYD